MADLAGGQSWCSGCGAASRPGEAWCAACRAASGRSASARAWGAVSVAFGALVLIGSVIPWFAESSFALTDDMGSAWPMVVVGLVGVVGGVDGLRGSLLGPALAAGVGTVFVLLQVVMVRVLTQVPGMEMGGGGVAWTLAAIAAVLLVVAVLSALRADRAQGTAVGWLNAVVLVAGAVWVVGTVVPASPGLSMGDHVEWVLFGGDTFSDVVTVAVIGIPTALVVLAVATRSRAAHGLAAGSMAFWTLAAVSAAAGDGSSGDGSLRYAFGRFWPMLVGALGVAVGGCLAMLLPPRSRSFPAPFPAPFPPMSPAVGPAPGATRPAGRTPVVPVAPVVGVALLPIAGIIGAVQYAEGQDAFETAATYGPFGAASESELPDGPDGGGFAGDDGVMSDDGGTGGSLDVVCTGLVDSTIRSAWQDVDGAIHVVVLVDNDCEIDQQLDDPSAEFTLTSGGATVADATFDFSSDPVVVPAHGTHEAEIVFGPGTFVDLEAVETLGLGADATVGVGAGAGALGLSYSYTCTDALDGTAPSPGAEVAGEAIDSPAVPRTTTESDAFARLDEIARADEPFIESDVIDRWVPQISSKRPNVPLPDGSVWDAVSILEDHRAWRQRFPRVRLLWSGDYSTFEQGDFWVTIVAVPFDTAEEALQWCDARALPGEDCYAKLISHTHPHDDSTRLR